jgi:hypothetical protein
VRAMYLRCWDYSPVARPKLASRDYSRLSCDVGNAQLGAPSATVASWAVVAIGKYLVELLEGAIEPHPPQPPTQSSRWTHGLVI